MRPTNKVNFTLLGIETKQFGVIEDNYNSDAEVRFGVKFTFHTHPEEAVVSVFPTFHFEADGKIFLIVEAGCHFKITENAWSDMVKENKIIIPKGFVQHLAVITVGTSRGILHAKTENTKFNRFFIPPLNVTETITTDQVFDISNNE